MNRRRLTRPTSTATSTSATTRSTRSTPRATSSWWQSRSSRSSRTRAQRTGRSWVPTSGPCSSPSSLPARALSGAPGERLSRMGQNVVGAATNANKAQRATDVVRQAAVPRVQTPQAGRAEPAPVDVVIRQDRAPEAAQHIDDWQRANGSSEYTSDRPRAATNRRDSMRGQPRADRGMDRDEWPPACTREGGSGCSVRPIRSGDSAGAQLGGQLRGGPNGTRFTVRVE